MDDMGLLWKNIKEREVMDSMADLYAIMIATEKLEKLYVRDLVSAADYEPECGKLISHFKTLHSSLRSSVPSVELFAEKYKIHCPAAVNRLVVSGVPATMEHTAAAVASISATGHVAECVQSFITVMDAVKLNMVAVDQVHPWLSELDNSLSKLVEEGGTGIVPVEFEGRVKLKEWISKIDKMRASDELTEEDSRQLLFDLESSYNSFKSFL